MTYLGDERAVVRSNLWLRSADRVLLRMAEFEADTFEELFQQTKALEWEMLIPPTENSPSQGDFCEVSASQRAGLSEDR